MKLTQDCAVSGLHGHYLLSVQEGAEMQSYEVNESFAFLLAHFAGEAFDEADIVSALREHYGIDEAEAISSARSVMEIWRSFHLLRD